MAAFTTTVRQRKSGVTPNQQPTPKNHDIWWKWGSWLLFIAALLVVIFGLYALYSRLSQAKIEHVYVEGVTAQEQQDIVQQLKFVRENSYFSTDLQHIRDQVLRTPWVDRVVVSRAWPDSIVVRIIPRQAVARWGTSRLLSDDGVVFPSKTSVSYQALPLIHGPQSQARLMMNKYNDINQMFAPLGLHLSELYLTERMTWFLQFDNGLRVIVDQNQTMLKLQQLSRLAQRDLQPVWQNIAAIDLRYQNGLAIQWKDAKTPAIQDGHFIVANDVPAIDTVVNNHP